MIDTVSGFMIGEIGRLPHVQDIDSDDTDFTFKGYHFSIVDIDEKVISKVRVIRIDKDDDEDED